MKRKGFALATLGVTALVVLGQLALGSTGATAAPPEVKVFRVQLSGAQEEPDNAHGDADSAAAIVTFDGNKDEVCWQVLKLTLTTGEALPHAGHIHFAPPGVAGPIVIHFFGTGDGGPAPTSYPTKRTCRPVSPGLLDEILANPGQYYVNLHNATHPGGVVRGQLDGE